MTAGPPDLSNSSVACFAQGTEGDLRSCVVDELFAAGPSPSVIGLLFGVTLIGSLYIAGDGDVVVPTIVTILLGGAMVPLLPTQFVGAAYSMVVLGSVSAVLIAYQRYSGGRF